MAAKPIHEIFLPKAEGLAHLFRQTIPAMKSYQGGEAMSVDQWDEGDKPCLRFTRQSDHDAHVVFQNITSAGVADVTYGDSQITNQETLSSHEEIVDNRTGTGDIEVSFRELFSETDSKEKSETAGTSVSVEVTASEGVEGIADFEEKITAEAHAEIEQSEGREETHEDEDNENTTVPVGKRVRITEERSKADGVIPITANGEFSFGPITIGHHYHGHWHGSTTWETWSQLKDCVNGEAPDNWPLSRELKQHPVYNADKWALADVVAELRYQMKFEGRVMTSYRVEEF